MSERLHNSTPSPVRHPLTLSTTNNNTTTTTNTHTTNHNIINVNFQMPNLSTSPTVSNPPTTITPLKLRNRGIVLNAVSPASPMTNYNNPQYHDLPNHLNNANPNYGHSRSSLIATHASIEEPPLKDVPLPDLEKLMAMDINEQLRMLALKEMVAVEIKDQILILQNKLRKEEEELHRLREVIQRTLYKEMGGTTSASGPLSGSSGSQATSNSNTSTNTTVKNNFANKTAMAMAMAEPRDAAVRSTRTRRRTLSLTGQTSIAEEEGEEDSQRLDSRDSGAAKDAKDRPQSFLWSNLSKPLNLLGQFDTMLQNEFERSLFPQEYTQEQVQEQVTTKQEPEKPGSLYEEKIQNVSLSLWSFVSEVRTNLSSLGESEKSELMYNLDTGSTVSLDDFEKSKTGKSKSD